MKGAGTPKRQGSVGHQAPPTPDPEAGDGDHQSAAIALDNTLPGKRSRRSEGQGVGEAGGDEIRSSPSAKFGRTCAGLGAGGTVNLTGVHSFGRCLGRDVPVSPVVLFAYSTVD